MSTFFDPGPATRGVDPPLVKAAMLNQRSTRHCVSDRSERVAEVGAIVARAVQIDAGPVVTVNGNRHRVIDAGEF